MGSAYGDAIDALRESVVDRSRGYKRLVITVSLGGLASAGAAAGFADVRPLLALVLLPALVLNHARIDLQKVLQWRAKVLGAWVSGELQLSILVDTVRRVPALPAGTVQGMLDCLPDWSAAGTTQAARAALARAQAGIGDAAVAALGVRALAWAVAAAALVLATLARQPLWLMAAVPAPLAAVAWLRLSRRRLDARVALPPPALVDPADAEGYERGRAGLNWQGHGPSARTPADRS